MDKNNISLLSKVLFAELLIGAIILKYPNGLSIQSVKSFTVCNSYSEEDIKRVIQNLISYGLVVPNFHDKAKLVYCITDFGKYYFDKLSEQNRDIKELIIQIGGESF